MPRGWRDHWGFRVAESPELSATRDLLIHTIGNLTLVTKKLNVALSNRPWTDEEAVAIAPTGIDAGLGKRSLLKKYSLLLLKEDIVEKSVWTEQDIEARGARLTNVALKAWPRG